MAEQRIIWSDRAFEELMHILEYYNDRNRSIVYSNKILDSVEQLLFLITKNNFLGRLTSDEKVRVINLDIFLIFYEISSDRIDILSFWDNRQNPKK